VAAKAAGLGAEQLLYDLEAELLAAYRRFLGEPLKRDPNCIAKSAIAQALVDLECNDVPFFIDGLHYRQLEPVWGGSVDSAVNVRCSCAMGLVATGYPRALHELTVLLSDAEANARSGAVRAISCANPREAELLLRFKVLTGDPEPEVIADCFTGLLSVEPDESPSFVARYLADADEVIRELAALALGESRLPEALAYLQKAWKQSILVGRFHGVLVRAAALHRSDAAFDWLLSMVGQADPALVGEVLEALAVYKRNTTLTERILRALAERNDQRLQDRFDRLWE
jgi:HEAT repeat protein